MIVINYASTLQTYFKIYFYLVNSLRVLSKKDIKYDQFTKKN